MVAADVPLLKSGSAVEAVDEVPRLRSGSLYKRCGEPREEIVLLDIDLTGDSSFKSAWGTCIEYRASSIGDQVPKEDCDEIEGRGPVDTRSRSPLWNQSARW